MRNYEKYQKKRALDIDQKKYFRDTLCAHLLIPFFVQSCFDTNVNLVCAEGLRKECDYVKIIIGKGNQII